MAQFQHGLCDCCSDCKAFCMTYWCPCMTYGKIQATQGEDYMKCCCYFFWTMELVPCWTIYQLASLRERVRQSKGIEGSLVMDCCTAYWCPCCVLIQLARETNALDGSLNPIERQ